jgi:hypothetical protein
VRFAWCMTSFELLILGYQVLLYAGVRLRLVAA